MRGFELAGRSAAREMPRTGQPCELASPGRRSSALSRPDAPSAMIPATTGCGDGDDGEWPGDGVQRAGERARRAATVRLADADVGPGRGAGDVLAAGRSRQSGGVSRQVRLRLAVRSLRAG